jgi:hypothetical protein
VSSGNERLGQIDGELAQAQQEAATLKPYADFAKATKDRREAVTRVAEARFDWDRALRELSQVAPGDVWLTSAKGTLTSETAVEGGGGDSGGLRGALAGPALELAGCGKRERDVPRYMDRLYSMSGVVEVGFSRTEHAGAAAGSGGAGACVGSNGPSSFSLVTYFKQSPALAAAAAPPAAAGAPGVAAPAPAAAAPPAGSTPATTPPVAAPAAANQTAASGTGGPR